MKMKISSPWVLYEQELVYSALSRSRYPSEAPGHSPALPLQTGPASGNRELWYNVIMKVIMYYEKQRQPIGESRQWIKIRT